MWRKPSPILTCPAGGGCGGRQVPLALLDGRGRVHLGAQCWTAGPYQGTQNVARGPYWNTGPWKISKYLKKAKRSKFPSCYMRSSNLGREDGGPAQAGGQSDGQGGWYCQVLPSYPCIVDSSRLQVSSKISLNIHFSLGQGGVFWRGRGGADGPWGRAGPARVRHQETGPEAARSAAATGSHGTRCSWDRYFVFWILGVARGMSHPVLKHSMLKKERKKGQIKSKKGGKKRFINRVLH